MNEGASERARGGVFVCFSFPGERSGQGLSVSCGGASVGVSPSEWMDGLLRGCARLPASQSLRNLERRSPQTVTYFQTRRVSKSGDHAALLVTRILCLSRLSAS